MSRIYRRRRIGFLIVVIAAIILIILGLRYCGKETEPVQPVEPVQGSQVTFEEVDAQDVGNVVFASSVTDDFEFLSKQGSTFKAGEPLWIYAELLNYPEYKLPEGKLVRVTMGMITFAPDGTIQEPMTGKVIEVNDFIEDISVLKFAAQYDTTGMMPGTYSVDTIFIDEVSGTPRTLRKEFVIQ